MANHRDSSCALYPKTGGGRGFETKTGVYEGAEHKEVEGLVETPYGFVRAYSQYWKGRYSTSCVEMIKDGKTHYRRWDKAFSKSGLVTKAKQFANELYA